MIAIAVLMSFPSLGLAGDGVVALQTADPACPDDSSDFYVDCGNGTVTDNRTGLVWLKEATCFSAVAGVNWPAAMNIVAGLSDLAASATAPDCALSDNSSPGEWRLPTFTEWETMIADAVALGCVGISGAPPITNDRGTNCWTEGVGVNSFVDIKRDLYWSATTDVGAPSFAWTPDLSDGSILSYDKDVTLARAWPVRGGQ